MAHVYMHRYASCLSQVLMVSVVDFGDFFFVKGVYIFSLVTTFYNNVPGLVIVRIRVIVLLIGDRYHRE